MTRAMVKNLADEEQVRSAEHSERYERRRELADLRLILDTEHGRRFLWNLMKECQVFGSVFNNSGSVTYFNEGRRDVGRKILNDVTEASDESLILMMRESKARERKDAPEGD